MLLNPWKLCEVEPLRSMISSSSTLIISDRTSYRTINSSGRFIDWISSTNWILLYRRWWQNRWCVGFRSFTNHFASLCWNNSPYLPTCALPVFEWPKHVPLEGPKMSYDQSRKQHNTIFPIWSTSFFNCQRLGRMVRFRLRVEQWILTIIYRLSECSKSIIIFHI